MSGVYQIYNTVNGKRYIGSSIHIEQRFKEHLRNLRANKHVNAHLQSAWNKYGEHSFILEEIELCEPDQCLKVEQEYIDYYHAADRKFGYNIDPYADHAGNTLSEETRKKISEKAKGRNISEGLNRRYANYKNRPTGFNIKAIFSEDVKYYPSKREAARQLGIDNGAITYCIRNTQGYCGKLNCTFVQISKEEYEEATA